MRSSDFADTADHSIVRHGNSELKVKICEVTNAKAHVWTKTFQIFLNELLKEGKLIIPNRETINIENFKTSKNTFTYTSSVLIRISRLYL